jgi:hypothetical protein
MFHPKSLQRTAAVVSNNASLRRASANHRALRSGREASAADHYSFLDPLTASRRFTRHSVESRHNKKSSYKRHLLAVQRAKL